MLPEEFGKYTLLSRLGTGGMAEVFLARTQSIGGFQKLLAIKRLLPFCTQDQETVDLLADEARITVRLTHPNIVQVFDFGRSSESYFIAMEYVDGLDLKSLIRIDELTSTPMELKLALFVTTCILDALDFAHTQRDAKERPLGIIHRDVSPHNVLISRHGQVKLTDFGVARAAISIHVSRVGDIRGKFSYMPPEQVCGGEIDHRVDIFAAGAILYELLAGKQPYRSASAGEQLDLLRYNMQPPSALRRDLPSELDAICLRALDKDPKNRFSSAAEFAAVLREQSLRVLGATLPPTGSLAELVELRLSQLADERPEHSDLMGLADYSATGDSLIAEVPVAARVRQTLREDDPPPTEALLPVDTDVAEPPLLGVATDLEPMPPDLEEEVPLRRERSADLDNSETVVAFRVPSAVYAQDLRSGELSDPSGVVPLREPPREPRRRASAPLPRPAMVEVEDHSPRSDREPDSESLFTELARTETTPHPAFETRASISVDDLGPEPEPRPGPRHRSRRGMAQIVAVLVASFIIGVALAVLLATCPG